LEEPGGELNETKILFGGTKIIFWRGKLEINGHKICNHQSQLDGISFVTTKSTKLYFIFNKSNKNMVKNSYLVLKFSFDLDLVIGFSIFRIRSLSFVQI
jgi:hypothetical protein